MFSHAFFIIFIYKYVKLPSYIKNNFDITQYNTLGIKCTCKYFALPKNIIQLLNALKFAKKQDVKVFILGNGSNVLFKSFYDGMVICFKKYIKNFYLNESLISVSAGMSLFELNKLCLKKNLSGLEFSYGIPASVGGFVKMNAGAFGGYAQDVVSEVTYIDSNLNISSAKKDEIEFENKNIRIKGMLAIIAVTFKLKSNSHEHIYNKMEEVLTQRLATQPYNEKSAGCFFKRSNDIFPAKIIDDLSLKGLRIGDAMVSTKHAGFIVNKENATSDDILKLAGIIKCVAKCHGIVLEQEVILVE